MLEKFLENFNVIEKNVSDMNLELFETQWDNEVIINIKELSPKNKELYPKDLFLVTVNQEKLWKNLWFKYEKINQEYFYLFEKDWDKFKVCFPQIHCWFKNIESLWNHTFISYENNEEKNAWAIYENNNLTRHFLEFVDQQEDLQDVKNILTRKMYENHDVKDVFDIKNDDLKLQKKSRNKMKI